MSAAYRGSNETVAFLLSKGASPDLMDGKNDTALVDALKSKCSSTIDLLAPVTAKSLDRALMWLAAYHTELTTVVEDLLRRAASDKDAHRTGVFYVAPQGC